MARCEDSQGLADANCITSGQTSALPKVVNRAVLRLLAVLSETPPEDTSTVENIYVAAGLTVRTEPALEEPAEVAEQSTQQLVEKVPTPPAPRPRRKAPPPPCPPETHASRWWAQAGFGLPLNPDGSVQRQFRELPVPTATAAAVPPVPPPSAPPA